MLKRFIFPLLILTCSLFGENMWHSAALSTGAELLYNEGRYPEALELADMAWEADPEWQRNLDLVIEINRAQSLAQEEF